jgi:tetratricopeptide (TPR) repeat protein
MRIRKLISFCVLIIPSLPAVGQDSLVRYNDLRFGSDLERKSFNNFFGKNDRSQLLPVLISISAGTSDDDVKNVSNRIEGVTSSLASTGIDKRKPDKKIKAVYDQVHSSLLKKYEMENRFYEIFLSGNYNCVTATALYSLVFENLQIPYEIKEEPTHVYLLAYPNANNILVETTAPLYGFLNFDPKFKERFIMNLKDQKLIGTSELESKTLEELFNTHYFKNDKIDLTKLVGIHYMNDALFKNDHRMAKEAYQQAQKAYWFYPSARCEYLLVHFGAVALSEEKKALEKAKLIAQISRLTKQGVTNDMIKGEFTNLTQDVLFRSNNKTQYKECYEIIHSGVQDQELADDIEFTYNYELGRVYYNQGNYTTAQGYFEHSLKMQPNNVEITGIFVSVISQNMRHTTGGREAIDSLQSYKRKFPSLVENNNFNSMLATATVMQFGECYQKSLSSAGDSHRQEFEAMMKSNRNLNVSQSIIGGAYSAACSYYFKRGQKAKAKEIVSKGLELAPGNYELRARQQMLQ